MSSMKFSFKFATSSVTPFVEIEWSRSYIEEVLVEGHASGENSGDCFVFVLADSLEVSYHSLAFYHLLGE